MQNEKPHITTPGNPSSEELYRFGADGNMRLYSYDGGTTRNYKNSCYFEKNRIFAEKLRQLPTIML